MKMEGSIFLICPHASPLNDILFFEFSLLVIIESDQSTIFCFFFQGSSPTTPTSSEIWLTDPVSDLPVWSNLLPDDLFALDPNIPEESLKSKQIKANLRFSILWKAHIINSDGTSTTLFGENCLPNPYVVMKKNLGMSGSNYVLPIR